MTEVETMWMTALLDETENSRRLDGVSTVRRSMALAWRAETTTRVPEAVAAGARHVAADDLSEAFRLLKGATRTWVPSINNLNSGGANSSIITCLALAAWLVLAVRHDPPTAPELRNRLLEALTELEDGDPAHYSLTRPRMFLVNDEDEGPSIEGPWIDAFIDEFTVQFQESWSSIPIRAGHEALNAGDVVAAERLLRLAMQDDHARVVGDAINSLAFSCLIPQGRLDEAETLLVMNVGSPHLTEGVNSRSNLGIVAHSRGELQRADRLFREVLASGSEFNEPEANYYLGLITREGNDPQQSEALLIEAFDSNDPTYSNLAKEELAPLGLIEQYSTSPATALESTTKGDQPYATVWNALGYRLVHEERIEEGLGWLKRAARVGIPWAMANYNWTLLNLADPARAVALFDEVESTIVQFVESAYSEERFGDTARSQLTNVRSNDALCRLALGNEPKAALDVWSEVRTHDHVESKFYPAVIAFRAGDREAAMTIASSLSPDEHDAMLKDLADGVAAASGWFADWCKDGITILTEAESVRPASPAAGPLMRAIPFGDL